MSKTYEPIARITLTADSTPSFTNIPNTYTDLVLVMSLRSSSAVNNRYFGLRFNSDSGTNYSYTLVYGTGSTAGSNRESNFSRAFSGPIPGSTAAAGTYGTVEVHIMSYANTNVFKTAVASMADAQHTDYGVGRSVALWRSTSAITSIEISDYGASAPLQSGSTISLYGVKSESPVLPLLTESTKTTSSVSAIISNYDAGLTYTLASTAGTATRSGNTVTVSGLTEGQNITLTVTATDGNNSSSSNTISLTSDQLPTGGTITTASGYRIHTFTSSGTFTVYSGSVNAEYLIVAGGGGGGGGNGGGGGGGQVKSGTSTVPAASYSVVVGGAGAAGSYNVNGSNGTDSSALSITSLKGNGGPAGNNSGVTGGTSGSGFAGGAGLISFPVFASGGGGGNSAAGGAPGGSPPNTGGSGGAGTNSSISGSTIGYGGGGGGGFERRDSTLTLVAGAGQAGGGNGGIWSTNSSTGATAGSANRGGGGGGGFQNASGAAAGSGVVIIRYPV